jgi:hypothetical protein
MEIRSPILDAWIGHCDARHWTNVPERGENRVDQIPPQQAETRGRLGTVSYGLCADRKMAADYLARHTAAPPTVYGTVMNYVALRILGMGPDEGPMTDIRALIHEMGEVPR